jgi:ankyrin repeat protein
MQELLADGADPNEEDAEGRVPLHFASGYGEVACAARLLDAGARIDARDHNGNSPLVRV